MEVFLHRCIALSPVASSLAMFVGGTTPESYAVYINTQRNTIRTKSAEEFCTSLEHVSRQQSLIIKTLILPEGVDLSDSRLRHAQPIASRTYQLQPGSSFIWPTNPYLLDIDSSLSSSLENFTDGDVRYRVRFRMNMST